MILLETLFINLVSNYSDDNLLISEAWKEIDLNYSSKKRFYHTTEHLKNIFDQLSEVKKEITNWESILFSLFYHDLIYNITKSDNEEKSADIAVERMSQFAVPIKIVDECKQHIVATKSHFISGNNDTNYFTDADLSILGSPREEYNLYHQNVRREYSIYPDLLYKQGRKKVLKSFFEMERIYKTEYFYNKFEKLARSNIQFELNNI